MHYAAPSSLPSDYAILSRYAGHNGDAHEDDSDAEERERDSLLPPEDEERPGRRSSLPPPFIRPLNPTIAPISARDKSLGPVPTENTPLLNPLVPRIEEEVDAPGHDSETTLSRRVWEEIKILVKYTLPVFGSHVLEYSLVVASVISIGHLSTTALAAATLGSMTASVTGLSIVQGFASALDTMLPSAWTSSEPKLVGLWAQRMAVVMAACLIPILFVWFNAESILLFLKQEPEVAHLAGIYLKWTSIGLPAYMFNSISRRYFQSQGLFTVPTRIIMVVAPINAVLNYFLVWGPKPFSLGFIGAPIATAISFNLISIASIIYGVFFVPRTAWYPISRRSFTSLGILVQLGLSGAAQVCSEWWSWELVGLAASLLGPAALATQSVLLVSASTTFQAPFALSVATSVRVGNLLGEENAKRAGIAANSSLLVTLAIASIASTMFMIFRKSWGHLFNDDPAVVELVASILPLVALFQVFDGLGATTGGILRARGKQFTGAMLNLSGYYLIGIPFGLWLAFKRDMGLAGLWIGLTVSLVFVATIGAYLCLGADWEREVEKVRVRLAADKRAEQRAGAQQHV
ncbi:MATE efflux family protein [Gloeophyllum trabeum ATCC 11539]|uniref:MATE efflux family protein n=1 Tax=Gloeophyllum trabeum (strain ATCC 11539 / FP-39264 / Madison 617) TaxID=670483 RepID=S7RLD4_GLOTA|nr:MATE efflux family protein [Gloeophyllum trabeum ATCC 11539]EPQ53474.1 MATE efflux family protein [Gloeophyllum trabeum ATCC 11539]